METTSILKLVTPRTYFTKIDLKDAYSTISIAAEHQKYQKFSHRNNLYEFTCVPNGYCHGPRKFIKSLKPLLSALRLDGVTIAAYLDDSINMNRSFQECWENTKLIIQTFQNLGFTVHPEPKSVFHPSQKIEFLGLILNWVTMTITLIDKKQRQLSPFAQTFYLPQQLRFAQLPVS